MLRAYYMHQAKQKNNVCNSTCIAICICNCRSAHALPTWIPTWLASAAPDSCTLIFTVVSSKKLPRGDQVACSLNWNAICHNSQGCTVTSKQWGFAKDKRIMPTILIPCTFPVLTLNGSLFSFSVTQVTTVNILYIPFRQKLYHIYKTVSLDYLYETLIQTRAGDHSHFSNVPRLQCYYVRID